MARKKPAKPTDSDPYTPRVRRLRRLFSDAKVDALLVTNPRDVHYLTGFRGDDSYVLVGRRKPVVISDFRFQEELEAIAGRVRVVIRKGAMVPTVAALVKASNPGTIGLQAEYLTIAGRKVLAKALGARNLRDTIGLVSRLRIVKDDAELKIIRRAIHIQQDALSATLATIKPGQTEEAVCARLEYEMKCRGASEPSFPSIVAAQANGSLPHAVPGKTKLRAGRPLLIDWGARVDGYCSDLTRTFSLGSMSRKIAEIYDIVLEAQLAAIAAVRPGAGTRAVDAVARDIITNAGYGDCYGHGLGHGVGLDVHEEPGLNTRTDTELRPGMLITVEPGIYLPGVGGVRIEDDVLVTQRGHKVLSNFPKDRASMVL
ncbi:MAG: aminopeptidase P family protein [Phycisphaerales bacterium]|nr:aminopeptidase P family protein [Phycisphaerales bacterium]